jgi:hypothetical protein
MLLNLSLFARGIKYNCYNIYKRLIRKLIIFIYLLLARIKHRRKSRVVFISVFMLFKDLKDIINIREDKVEC